MNVLDFGVEVIAISASGVLAPGPMFFANLLYGARQGTAAGLKIAYGHTAVELPLIILLAAGLFSSGFAAGQYSDAIGVVGGAAILAFAGAQVVTIIRKKGLPMPAIGSRNSPFIAGVALSALNPFFLIWWFTIGLKLIADSVSFGPIAGVALLFGLHIWMDYVWLAGTAYFAAKGGSMLKSKYYPLLLLGLAAVLLYYGVYFIMTGMT